MPNGRCWAHGGNTPSGIASPHYQGKGYSKYLPIGLIDTFNEFRNDKEKLALDDQIALVDTYATQLMEELGDYSSAELWEQLQSQVIEYHKATEAEQRNLLSYIFQTIEAGASYVSKWDTLHKTMEQRRKLVADERKRRIEMEQMVTAEQAMLLVSGLMESVRQNVNDRTILTAIQADFIRLAGSAQRKIDSRAGDGAE